MLFEAYFIINLDGQMRLPAIYAVLNRDIEPETFQPLPFSAD